MSQARFQKLQREKAKREKLAAKRERKAARLEAAENEETDAADLPPESKVLAELAKLHERFDNDEIEFDEFEERKQELTEQLDI